MPAPHCYTHGSLRQHAPMSCKKMEMDPKSTLSSLVVWCPLAASLTRIWFFICGMASEEGRNMEAVLYWFCECSFLTKIGMLKRNLSCNFFFCVSCAIHKAKPPCFPDYPQ
mmetsp:Transcript_56381/g.76890  ORF Transcript_56381/g.76890 Transcript_56381/m.76890 type:complete len:111 (-) Transcript_56381:71-403(-)